MKSKAKLSKYIYPVACKAGVPNNIYNNLFYFIYFIDFKVYCTFRSILNDFKIKYPVVCISISPMSVSGIKEESRDLQTRFPEFTDNNSRILEFTDKD